MRIRRIIAASLLGLLLIASTGLCAEDAPLVARLRRAGGLLLGLTNVAEAGLWLESHNKVYGRTNNAYSESHIAGGSSGGEGAIIGAGGSPMGIGADIGLARPITIGVSAKGFVELHRRWIGRVTRPRLIVTAY